MLPDLENDDDDDDYAIYLHLILFVLTLFGLL